MIRVVCKSKLKSGANIEEYVSMAKKVVEASQKEEGCTMYILHQDINDPSVFATIEEWESEEAMQKHDKSEHVLKYVPELRKLRESTELNLYKEV